MKTLVLLLIFKLFQTVHSESSYVTVETLSGNVRGYNLSISGYNAVGSDVDTLHIFLGVPYAEPPVGDRRFTHPMPKAAWRPRTIDALRLASSCPQGESFLQTYDFAADYADFDEDCLYLNVYVPQSWARVDATWPVMVFIHGGSYTYGSGGAYDGRILAQEGVVVVTVNYRVDALGFLSTDDDVAPGNYGLLDQLTALRWVKDNIARFHGDASRITVFGQSAGGSGVSLHMFSPLANGLFTSLIPQSGTAFSPFAIYRPPHSPRTYALELGLAVGCPQNTSAALVACLRTKDALLLARTPVSPPMIATFAPRVDGYFLTDLPEVLMMRGAYLKCINILTGYLPNEVAEDYESVDGINNGLSKETLESMFHDKSRRFLSNADEIYQALTCAYPPSNDVIRNRKYLIDMNSDYGYVSPHIRLAESLVQHKEHVWLYEFTYRSPNSQKREWIGVPHAEELYYQFGAPFFDSTPCPAARNLTCQVKWGTYQQWDEHDRRVARNTMQLWADFARLPACSSTFPSTAAGSGEWPPFGQNHALLNISNFVRTAHLQMTSGQRLWASFNYLNLSAPVPDVCGREVHILVGK
ncbi:acetylcholinesterase-like isoform X2 [Mya arenaria]|uniref:acetylcholinesterase-like isoform X2 n=1 Tax=Mya arenaria TaxID=6604 RepID=UPI0022DF470E|nr:acetylcholinesterase-like isoform X2 [Mya arenaria]